MERGSEVFWIATVIMVISLILPWATITELGQTVYVRFFDFLANFKPTYSSDYSTAMLVVLADTVVGIILLIIGGLVGRRGIAFTGALFTTFAAIAFLYAAYTPVQIGYTSIALADYISIGFWLFLASTAVVTYILARKFDKVTILLFILLVAVLTVILATFAGKMLEYVHST